MEIKIKRTIDFIPKWEGNDKADLPVVFHLRYLSVGELDDCYNITPTRVGKKGKVTEGKVDINSKQMFHYAVVDIENLIIDDGEKKTGITTSDLLLSSPGLDLLFYEVSAYISAMSARIDSKN